MLTVYRVPLCRVQVRLTLSPQLVSRRTLTTAGDEDVTLGARLSLIQQPKLPSFGTVIEDAEVVRIEPTVGLLLRFKDDSAAGDGDNDDADASDTPKKKKRRSDAEAVESKESKESFFGAFVHISRVRDGDERMSADELARDYGVGKRVRCRIIARGASLESWASGDACCFYMPAQWTTPRSRWAAGEKVCVPSPLSPSLPFLSPFSPSSTRPPPRSRRRRSRRPFCAPPT